MKKITKKELKKIIETAISNALKKLDLVASKKTKKAIAKVAKTLKADLNDETKKVSKKRKESKKAKGPTPIKAKKKPSRAAAGGNQN
jgi:hypothetical protein